MEEIPLDTRSNQNGRCSRRDFLKASALATAGGLALMSPARAQGKKRPNIIFIMADDLGYGDLGCYGSAKIKTPNLDRMAAEGTRFTQCYAGDPVCGPSRASLLTGLHSGHTRLRRNIDDFSFRASDVLVSEVLRGAGYKTGVIGKWGMGAPGTQGMPLQQGFDEFFGYITHLDAHDPYPERLFRNDAQPVEYPNNRRDKTHFANDEFTREAKDFVQKHKAEPFFLYLSYTTPHASLEVPADSLAQYANEGWPEKTFGSPTSHYTMQTAPHAVYAAMISRMDAQIGELLAQLKALGLDENTIVLFTSDNGPHEEGGADPKFFDSAGPLRGIKRDLYEGGIRVPMIARWPGKIAPRVSEHVWYFPDFLATAAELGGAKAPETDGISVVPALLGREQTAHKYLYWEFQEGGFKQAVRLGDWKGVRVAPNKQAAFAQTPELYDLRVDIGEKTNVAAQHPDIAQRIAEIMRTARVEVENLQR